MRTAPPARRWSTVVVFGFSLVLPLTGLALLVGTAVYCLGNAEYEFVGAGGTEGELRAWSIATTIVLAPFLTAAAIMVGCRVTRRGWLPGLAVAAPFLFATGFVACAYAYIFAGEYIIDPPPGP